MTERIREAPRPAPVESPLPRVLHRPRRLPTPRRLIGTVTAILGPAGTRVRLQVAVAGGEPRALSLPREFPEGTRLELRRRTGDPVGHYEVLAYELPTSGRLDVRG